MREWTIEKEREERHTHLVGGRELGREGEDRRRERGRYE